MGCVWVYMQTMELHYWWEYGFSSIIVAQDSDGVFLCAEFLRFCLFQYNLNSTFSICNSGQTLNSRLLREKN